jgi:S-adenosylmethionine synthetase
MSVATTIENAVEPMLTHDSGAKAMQYSASLQGIGVVVAPWIAQLFGLDTNAVVHNLDILIQAIGILWAAYGVLRRKDIRLPWQKAT